MKIFNHQYCDELLADLYTTVLDSLLPIIRKQRGSDYFGACKCLCSLVFTSGAGIFRDINRLGRCSSTM